jgi:hypothetical protein
MWNLRPGFSQIKKGKNPKGFSRKAKAKRKVFFLQLGLKPGPADRSLSTP